MGLTLRIQLVWHRQSKMAWLLGALLLSNLVLFLILLPAAAEQKALAASPLVQELTSESSSEITTKTDPSKANSVKANLANAGPATANLAQVRPAKGALATADPVKVIPALEETPLQRLQAFQALLAKGDAEAAQRTLFALAAKTGLSLDEASYERVPESKNELPQLRMTVPVTGSYAAIRQFSAQVLRALPAVALSRAAFKRDSVEASTVSATLVFVLFLPAQASAPASVSTSNSASASASVLNAHLSVAGERS